MPNEKSTPAGPGGNTGKNVSAGGQAERIREDVPLSSGTAEAGGAPGGEWSSELLEAKAATEEVLAVGPIMNAAEALALRRREDDDVWRAVEVVARMARFLAHPMDADRPLVRHAFDVTRGGRSGQANGSLWRAMCVVVDEASEKVQADIAASPPEHHTVIWNARATMLAATIAAQVFQVSPEEAGWFYARTPAECAAVAAILKARVEGAATTGAVADLVLLARSRSPAGSVLGTIDATSTRERVQRAISNALRR